MANQTQAATAPKQAMTVEKIDQLRELFAEAPELGRKALDSALGVLPAAK